MGTSGQTSVFPYRTEALKVAIPCATNHRSGNGNTSPSPATEPLFHDGYVDLLKPGGYGVIIPYVSPASCDALAGAFHSASFQSDKLHCFIQLGAAVELRRGGKCLKDKKIRCFIFATSCFLLCAEWGKKQVRSILLIKLPSPLRA